MYRKYFTTNLFVFLLKFMERTRREGGVRVEREMKHEKYTYGTKDPERNGLCSKSLPIWSSRRRRRSGSSGGGGDLVREQQSL